MPRSPHEDDVLPEVYRHRGQVASVFRILFECAPRVSFEIRRGTGLPVERLRGGDRAACERDEAAQQRGGCERRRRHQGPGHQDIGGYHVRDGEEQGDRWQGELSKLELLLSGRLA